MAQGERKDSPKAAGNTGTQTPELARKKARFGKPTPTYNTKPKPIIYAIPYLPYLSLTLLLLNHRVVSVGMVGQALMSSRSFLSNTSVCSDEKHARLEKDLRQRSGRKRRESCPVKSPTKIGWKEEQRQRKTNLRERRKLEPRQLCTVGQASTGCHGSRKDEARENYRQPTTRGRRRGWSPVRIPTKVSTFPVFPTLVFHATPSFTSVQMTTQQQHKQREGQHLSSACANGVCASLPGDADVTRLMIPLPSTAALT